MATNDVLGEKFEVWIEQLLKDLHYAQVRRNVTCASSNARRQVDVEYRVGLLLPYKVIVECKYSTNGPIRLKPLSLNKGKAGKKRSIDDLVDEVEERRIFVKAKKAVICTNTSFFRDLEKKAKRRGIVLLDYDALSSMDWRRRGLSKYLPFVRQRSIDKQINATKVYDEHHYERI